MTGGFATIAGTVLAAYIGFGIPADQIISGSVMAAPTALAVSKLIYPETEESKTTFKNIKMEKERLRGCWRQRGPPPFRHISKEQASPLETKN